MSGTPRLTWLNTFAVLLHNEGRASNCGHGRRSASLARIRFSRGLLRRSGAIPVAEQPRRPHAQEHGWYESERAGGAQSQRSQAWSWTIAAEAPANAEDHGPNDEPAIYVLPSWNMEAVVGQRFGAEQHQPIADRGRQDRSAHHEGQRGIPGAEEVEEVQHLGGVGHA